MVIIDATIGIGIGGHCQRPSHMHERLPRAWSTGGGAGDIGQERRLGGIDTLTPTLRQVHKKMHITHEKPPSGPYHLVLWV